MMAKRFTDNEKWKKPFFKSLSSAEKLFFLYILDECDHAGVWHEEMDIAEIRVGEPLNRDSTIINLGKHIHVFDDGEKWFIPSFIVFQYGKLNPNVNAHKSVIDKLIKYNLIKTYEQFINCSFDPHLWVMDKDKDKDISNSNTSNSNIIVGGDRIVKERGGRRKRGSKAIPENLDEVLNYFNEKSIPDDDYNAEKFFNHYEANGWVQGKGKTIKNWKACVKTWNFQSKGRSNWVGKMSVGNG